MTNENETDGRPMTMGEIVEAEGGMPATETAPPSTALMLIQNSTAIQNFVNSGRSVTELHSLLDFQERLMKTQAEIDFNEALARVQEKMPLITKRGEIKNKAGDVVAKYLKYEDIDAVIRPLLIGEGFSLVHDRSEQNNKMVVTTWLKHRGGHKESVSIPLPYDQPNALKNAVQAAVSTFSYGKRINVCSLLNIVAENEDDDGQKSEAVPITDDQAQAIKDTLREESATPKETTTFLEYMGAENVEAIALKDYDRAVFALDVWKKRKADARAAKAGA